MNKFLRPGERPVFGHPPPKGCELCQRPFTPSLSNALKNIYGQWVCTTTYACRQRVIEQTQYKRAIEEAAAQVQEQLEKEREADAARLETLSTKEQPTHD